VLDSGDTAGHLWFTMPFVRGESLRERLRRETQLPVMDALRIAREAADALAFAHAEGVIHRDIKPENILLSGPHALVADFGIARALEAGPDARLTETGLAVGTPAYMSPEQASGQRELDARTDVYSLAVVLYEMLAGETPFAAPTAQAMIARRFTETAKPIRQAREAVPESVERVLQKGLARTPADRFASAAEFGSALEAAERTAERRDDGTAVREVGQRTSGSAPAASAVPPFRRSAVFALLLGLLIGAGVLFAWRRTHPDAANDGAGRVVAVLPFENLGDSADAYFADGVADEVRTKLTQVAGLVVIARGSSIQYRGTTKRPADIARELGADYLLTGTVRWEKAAGAASRVRVSPELVELRPGQAERNRWGEPFDAALTNVFEVQADIATKVANALGVALADSVRAGLETRPTANLEAYDAFLRGEAETASMGVQDIPSLGRGLPHYQRAVELDSTFLLAWARLAISYATYYGNAAPTAELAAKAAAASERARRLGPTHPESFMAQSYYERIVLRDTDRARATLTAGLRLAPSHVPMLGAMSSLERTTGNWDAGVTLLERAAALDPRSSSIATRLAQFLFYLRRYPEAEVAQRRAESLAPTSLTIIHQGAMLALAQGDRARAERIARTPAPGVDPMELAYQFARFEELGWLLNEEQQRQVVKLDDDFYEGDRGNWGLVNAQLHTMLGHEALARAYADSAQLAYEKNIRQAPEDGQLQSLRGLSLAYLGRREEAIREAERAVELVPIEKDAYFGPYLQLLLARVHMMVGSKDRAVELLEPLVELPNNLSKAWLRVDPTFEPLRSHPRFQALVGGTT
jgi:serine/threonine-protein kinase